MPSGLAWAQQSVAGQAACSVVPAGFNTYTRDYAAFCAEPAATRSFYALLDGTSKCLVEEKLDETDWKPAAGGYAPLPVAGGSYDGVPLLGPIPNLSGKGPYQPTWESLQHYDVPEWYRDAKFGIWAHWSPQCVPEQGDQYARLMYLQGNAKYNFHVRTYGHPSTFGMKDLCPLWKLEQWQPDELMTRFKAAGARIFMTLANHHDGFDNWQSQHHPWNAHAIGPKRDVVGDWGAAARKQGMRFGVTIHQAPGWWWFSTNHGSDHTGPLAGVPYDGAMTAKQGAGHWWEGLDPQRYYIPKHPFNALPDTAFVKNFYDRTRDLIDLHDPDLLYFDNPLLPLGWGGMNVGAYFYNHNLATHGGRMEGVLNVKKVPPQLAKAVVADYERGFPSTTLEHPWQSETCIGHWHYDRSLYDQPGEFGGYKNPREIIHWLIDSVSKNGTLILSIPGRPDGTIDSKEVAVLDQIAAWMKDNARAIHETRPWRTYYEGPTQLQGGSFQDKNMALLGARDIRFTRNKAGTIVYAIVLGVPEGSMVITSLGKAAGAAVKAVEVLGTEAKPQWTQSPDQLTIDLPPGFRPATDFAITFAVTLAG